jgi:hypothetical protein
MVLALCEMEVIRNAFSMGEPRSDPRYGVTSPSPTVGARRQWDQTAVQGVCPTSAVWCADVVH